MCLVITTGFLAQLGEHRFYTAGVGGSSPSGSTSIKYLWEGSEEAKRG